MGFITTQSKGRIRECRSLLRIVIPDNLFPPMDQHQYSMLRSALAERFPIAAAAGPAVPVKQSSSRGRLLQAHLVKQH